MDGSLLRISRALSLAYFSGLFAYLRGVLRVGALLRIYGAFPSTASTKRARRKTSFFKYAKETCAAQNLWRGKPQKFKYVNSNTQKRHVHLRRARRKTCFSKDAKETCSFQNPVSQLTATHCNSLQRPATQRNTMRLAAHKRHAHFRIQSSFALLHHSLLLLQCVAVCCSALQRVVVCCSVL